MPHLRHNVAKCGGQPNMPFTCKHDISPSALLMMHAPLSCHKISGSLCSSFFWA
jgi:hypothetical protein